MPRSVSIAEARNHLTKLLREVERGRAVGLSRRGKPVAVLVSKREYDRLNKGRRSVVKALHAWHAQLGPDFEGLSGNEIATLRQRSPGRDPRL